MKFKIPPIQKNQNQNGRNSKFNVNQQQKKANANLNIQQIGTNSESKIYQLLNTISQNTLVHL